MTIEYQPIHILNFMLYKGELTLSAPETIETIIEHEMLTACLAVNSALSASVRKKYIEYQQVLGPEENGGQTVLKEQFSNQADEELIVERIQTIISHLPYSKIDAEGIYASLIYLFEDDVFWHLVGEYSEEIKEVETKNGAICFLKVPLKTLMERLLAELSPYLAKQIVRAYLHQ